MRQNSLCLSLILLLLSPHLPAQISQATFLSDKNKIIHSLGISESDILQPISGSIFLSKQFDESGRLRNQTCYGWDGTGWQEDYRYTYSYSNNVNVTEERYQEWDDVAGEWANVRQWLYDYDIDGNRFDWLLQEWDEVSGWQNDIQIISSFTTSGLISEEIHSNWENESWVPFRRNSYSYAGNLLIEFVYQIWDLANNDWQNNTRNSYQIDSGRRIEDIRQNWNGSSWVNFSRIDYSYFQISGNIAERRFQNWVESDNDWVNLRRENFEYDNGDFLMDFLSQSWMNNDWQNTQILNITNDADGNPTEQIRRDWNAGNWTNVNRYIQTFDAVGNRIEQVFSEWSNGAWRNEQRVLQIFDGDNEVLEGLVQRWLGGGWINRSKCGYERDASTDIDRHIPIIRQYKIENYPNPFNPSTLITYFLPRASDVKIVVYDLLGREISVLVNAAHHAGQHELLFEASNLGSGLYFYRFEAEENIVIGKMMLIR